VRFQINEKIISLISGKKWIIKEREYKKLNLQKNEAVEKNWRNSALKKI
jgi:uncharacterized protein YlzI (FlbEa/FlbD family)